MMQIILHLIPELAPLLAAVAVILGAIVLRSEPWTPDTSLLMCGGNNTDDELPDIPCP